MTDIVPDKELDVYREQLATAEKFSTTLEIKTETDYQSALAEGKHIKEQLEIITARKEAITKPLSAALKSARELFAPLEAMGATALSIVKAKMTAFTDEQERKAAVKIDKIIDKVEAGKMSEEMANAKIFIATPNKTVVTEQGKATVSKLKKYYVVDKTLIPMMFLEPDMVRIKASFKAGTPVPGVEERLESNTSIG